MGWDVLILKLKDPSTPAGELDESSLLHLGEVATVRKAIDSVLPGVDWSDPTWGHASWLGCHLEFNLKSWDGFHLGIHVHGRGDPVRPIVDLCRANGWVVFDTTRGEFLNLEEPSPAGWERFQAFRDDIIRRS